MTPAHAILLCTATLALIVGMVAVREIRRRNMQRWLGSYALHALSRRFTGRPPRDGQVHVLLCIADHFEPAWGGASNAAADARVSAWVSEYPRTLGGFRDSDGRPPRHTFFYPIDQYESRHVDALAGLCRAGFGEIEIHLHHDHDTAESLDRTLRRFTQLLADRHGLLGRWARPPAGAGVQEGSAAYGFVHGNWALDNSRPDGRWCGVHNELDVLHRTGCYADFTLPSAPDITQTRKINSIYYAAGDRARPAAHDRGVDVGAAMGHPAGPMLIQGPLLIARPKGRLLPRVENACVQAGQPLTMERMNAWLRAGVRIRTRPDWLFVKLHTHGAAEANQPVLCGPPAADFHRGLADRAARDPRFKFYYVTAREMYNLARAAEAGWAGLVASVRDFAVLPPRPNVDICPKSDKE